MKNLTVHKIIDVTQRRISRAFFDLGPLGRSELADEAVEQTVEHVALARIK